jgi:hypothetical protein
MLRGLVLSQRRDNRVVGTAARSLTFSARLGTPVHIRVRPVRVPPSHRESLGSELRLPELAPVQGRTFLTA